MPAAGDSYLAHELDGGVAETPSQTGGAGATPLPPGTVSAPEGAPSDDPAARPRAAQRSPPADAPPAWARQAEATEHLHAGADAVAAVERMERTAVRSMRADQHEANATAAAGTSGGGAGAAAPTDGPGAVASGSDHRGHGGSSSLATMTRAKGLGREIGERLRQTSFRIRRGSVVGLQVMPPSSHLII